MAKMQKGIKEFAAFEGKDKLPKGEYQERKDKAGRARKWTQPTKRKAATTSRTASTPKCWRILTEAEPTTRSTPARAEIRR